MIRFSARFVESPCMTQTLMSNLGSHRALTFCLLPMIMALNFVQSDSIP